MPRTTHKSKSRRKLHAKRNKQGRFTHVQPIKRAQAQEIKRRRKQRKIT